MHVNFYYFECMQQYLSYSEVPLILCMVNVGL